jgi:hypothetical protein
MAWTRVKILRPGRVAQVLETELGDQGGDEQEAGIGHQIRVVEGHRDPIGSARY